MKIPSDIKRAFTRRSFTSPDASDDTFDSAGLGFPRFGSLDPQLGAILCHSAPAGQFLGYAREPTCTWGYHKSSCEQSCDCSCKVLSSVVWHRHMQDSVKKNGHELASRWVVKLISEESVEFYCTFIFNQIQLQGPSASGTVTFSLTF